MVDAAATIIFRGPPEQRFKLRPDPICLRYVSPIAALTQCRDCVTGQIVVIDELDQDVDPPGITCAKQ
jgi:hypothetical protein